ncbi:MAG: DNA primase [Pseudomonadota bacterium]
MALPNGFLDELRARVTLSDVVGRKVTWDRGKSNPARRDWWAPCPFHQEKTASFHVDDAKGYYYCFGCQAKGDAITFLREQENMGFMEAVEALAQEAGMPMPERDPREAARTAERQGLAEVMEACVRFYRLQLKAAAGREAAAYCAGRGLDEAALARFEIGAAPEGRRVLADAMAAKGVPEDDLVRAGMLIRPDDGGKPYDRFRGRVMFPIRDARGRCIAFGGRALSPDARAKYLNSPETELFDKGRSLYNHGPARGAAGKAGRLIVAEGYMDVIALARAGFEEAVAPLGTAVTENQLRLMWRMADEPILALDGDAAGLRAAYRAAELALPMLEPGKSLRFCLMPGGKDPDDLIKEDGAEAMAAALDAALPLVEMIWRKAMQGRDLSSPERRAALDKDLRGMLKRIEDPSVRAHYAQAVRERRDALFAPAAGAGGRRPATAPGRRFASGGFGGARGGFGFAEAPSPELRASVLVTQSEAAEVRIRESAILWGALHHPAVAERHEETLRGALFLNRDLSDLRDRLLDALPDCLEAERPGEALRGALGEALGFDPEPFLRSDRLALTRGLGPEAPRAQVEIAFSEVLDRHVLFNSAMEEREAAAQDISVDTADEIAARLAYIGRRRDAAAPRDAAGRRDADAGAEDGEEAVRAKLRGFYATEPWVKRPRRKN